MSKLTHLLGHAGLVAAGLVVSYAGLVPGKYAPLALAIQGVAQAVLALANHKTAVQG